MLSGPDFLPIDEIAPNAYKVAAPKATQMPPKTPRKKSPDRVYVEIDRIVRDKLRIIAAARGMRLIDLLNAVGNREIRAWEKLKDVSLDELRTRQLPDDDH